MLYLYYVIGNCDAISYYIKTLREDAQTAEMELIAAQYRGRTNCAYECKINYIISSINIPYPLQGLFTKTWVTAPIIFPFCMIGEPLCP